MVRSGQNEQLIFLGSDHDHNNSGIPRRSDFRAPPDGFPFLDEDLNSSRMRRFSQRNPLVTLSDINITPLLDLAFVLLIIFVIISPSIQSSHEQGMELNLPQGGGPYQQVESKNIHVVEIDTAGRFMLDQKLMPIDRIERELTSIFKSNPNLLVRIRVDQMGRNKDLYEIVDRCLRNGITKFHWATDSGKKS
jgi:biopolymer transport protein ExbD